MLRKASQTNALSIYGIDRLYVSMQTICLQAWRNQPHYFKAPILHPIKFQLDKFCTCNSLILITPSPMAQSNSLTNWLIQPITHFAQITVIQRHKLGYGTSRWRLELSYLKSEKIQWTHIYKILLEVLFHKFSKGIIGSMHQDQT